MACYSFGDFLLDTEARTLSGAGQPIALTARNFDTLLLLVQSRGRLVEKSELLSSVWRNTAVEDGSLTQAIFCIRKALGDRPREHRFIATVPGVGYQFVAPVAELRPGLGIPDPEVSRKDAKPADGYYWSSRMLAGAAILCIATFYSAWVWASRPVTPPVGAIVQITNDGKPKTELVTDGVRVFYASPTDQMLSTWRTFEVPATGGESRPLPLHPQNMSPVGISPDGAELLLSPSAVRQVNAGWKTPDRFWFQLAAGGPPRISGLEGHDASWSPDHQTIAYASRHQIHVGRSDGTSSHKLTDLPGAASGLRWSPDGKRIRFTHHSGTALKDTAIWEVAAQGGKAYPVFPDWKENQGSGHWTPDGKYYLFTRGSEGSSQIWAVPETSRWSKNPTRDAVQLTTGPMECYLPTPSPDGKRLFFTGVRHRMSLLKHNKTSGEFEPFLPGISGRHLEFSRDGRSVTYSSYPEKIVWRAAADGTQRMPLTPPEMIAMLPVISPDGSRIAFVGGRPGHPGSIFVVGFNGGELDPIVDVEPAGLVEPTWSPDGNSLVLGSINGSGDLHRFDFANRKLSVLPNSKRLLAPRWSPDGATIAAIDSRSGKLVLYDLRSRRTSELTDVASYNPAWGRDGRFLYFGSGAGDAAAWYRIRIADRKRERLVSLAAAGAQPAKPSRGLPTWIYLWTGLAPDDSLLITRETGTIELYSAAFGWR